MRALPEVASVGTVRFLAMDVNGDGTAVGAINPDAAGTVFDVGVEQGSYKDLDASSIAVRRC